jgi:hypothetical protein
VDAEPTVIAVGGRYREDHRAGLRGPLAIGVLLVGAAGAYYAYERWTPGGDPPATSAPIVMTAPSRSAARVPEAAAAAPATPTVAANLPAPPTTDASAARTSSTESDASVSAEPASASQAEVAGGPSAAPDASQPVVAQPEANQSAPTSEAFAATDAAPAQQSPSPALRKAGNEADGAKRVAAPPRRPRPVTSPSSASPVPARLPATLRPAAEVPAVALPAPGGACSDSVAALGLCNR